MERPCQVRNKILVHFGPAEQSSLSADAAGLSGKDANVLMDQGFMYLNFWPPRLTSNMAPPLTIVNISMPLV